MRNALDNFYTYSEKNDRKYTIYQAITSARSRLAKFKNICTDATKGRLDSEKITLRELNEIADQIVEDTRYHAVAGDYR